jgi:hypothetical protein
VMGAGGRQLAVGGDGPISTAKLAEHFNRSKRLQNPMECRTNSKRASSEFSAVPDLQTLILSAVECFGDFLMHPEPWSSSYTKMDAVQMTQRAVVPTLRLETASFGSLSYTQMYRRIGNFGWLRIFKHRELFCWNPTASCILHLKF